MQARWLDPLRGRVEVKASFKSVSRIIGLHNGMLRLAANGQRKGHTWWAEQQKQLLDNADGYIFHTNYRNSWACIITPGETSDVQWAEDSKPYFVEETYKGFTIHVEEDVYAPNYDLVYTAMAWSDTTHIDELSGKYWGSAVIAMGVAKQKIDKTLV